MSFDSNWSWSDAARRAGVAGDGTYNASGIALPERRAIIWCRADGSVFDLSGAQVRNQVMQLAARLTECGVGRGDRVAGMLSKRPESLTAALAVWYLGAVYVPLFSGFSGDGLRVRMADSQPEVMITDSASAHLLDAIQDDFPDLARIVVDADGPVFGDLDTQIGDYLPVATKAGDIATIMYTSGTTGKPKGCLMPHDIFIGLSSYLTHALALHPGEILFSGADAGWSFGLFTTGLAPLSVGNPRVIYEGPFNAAEWWAVMDRSGAHHLAAAPTAYRQLASGGAEGIPASFTAASSAGEPLDAPTAQWFADNADVTIYDCYGLSEIGMVVGNLRTPGAPPPIPGSMGVAVPGYDVAILNDSMTRINGVGVGRLAVKDNGHLISRGYWNRMPEWEARFHDGWFVTEDLVRRDEDGRYWYESRADDVIVASGMNIGPAEVETALMAHPLIADAGVVGVPDPVKGTIVTAHVVLNDKEPPDLHDILRAWVGERVGRHATARKIVVWDALPRTASGKLQRVNLRESLRNAPESPDSTDRT
ncbi:MAG: acyl-CoA synthetase [Antricoccus sp.]